MQSSTTIPYASTGCWIDDYTVKEVVNMKLALMQPYFFPYIGYFMLIAHSDKFIAFDTVQFEKGGWMNRNRILKVNGGFSYINAQIQKSHIQTAIKDIKLSNSHDWRQKILHQLEVYKKAPFYSQVMDFLRDCFSFETDSLSELNIYLLKRVCDYLDIDHDIEVFSEMDIEIEDAEEPDEWGLNISKAIRASEYINAPGGATFYSREKYEEAGITLQFIEANLSPYDQNGEVFEPGLSIIDVMMFNSKSDIDKMLDDYRLF